MFVQISSIFIEILPILETFHRQPEKFSWQGTDFSSGCFYAGKSTNHSRSFRKITRKNLFSGAKRVNTDFNVYLYKLKTGHALLLPTPKGREAFKTDKKEK